LSINISEEKITIKKAPINPIEYTIIGDMVEASSYIIAGLITNGEIIVSGFETYELNSFFNVC
jgi:UDP-N-acetylglucosamine enolpyruvyl transferase